MKRILIVDDEIDTLNLLRMILELSGYQAFTTLNSVDAITLAEIERPDCILLDIMMPQLDGFTLCKMMRLHPSTAHLPIVFVTAYSALDLDDRRKEAGADMILPKPIGMDALIETVEQAIQLRAASQKAPPDDLSFALSMGSFTRTAPPVPAPTVTPTASTPPKPAGPVTPPPSAAPVSPPAASEPAKFAAPIPAPPVTPPPPVAPVTPPAVSEPPKSAAPIPAPPVTPPPPAAPVTPPAASEPPKSAAPTPTLTVTPAASTPPLPAAPVTPPAVSEPPKSAAPTPGSTPPKPAAPIVAPVATPAVAPAASEAPVPAAPTAPSADDTHKDLLTQNEKGSLKP